MPILLKLSKAFNVIPGWVYAIIIVLMGIALVNRQLAVEHARTSEAQAQASEQKIRADHQELIAKAATATVKASEEAREKEFKLITKITSLEKKRNEDVATITASYNRVVGELRSRPARPAPADPAKPSEGPKIATACQGASGADLYREDGVFLIGEAARADVLRSALETCYIAWDSAEALINKASPPNDP